LAEEAGLVVKSNVSRRLTYLVAADPTSLSGKAQAARERGVAIVHEYAFWQALGITVSSSRR
jgi:DNA polymerase-3 subunit epsilon